MKNKKLPKTRKFVVGIDEVGRGPLAGPVAVCAFKMGIDFNARAFGPIKDSKQLTAENREAIFRALHALKKKGKVDYSVSYEDARTIDSIGIGKAIKNCLEASLGDLNLVPEACEVLLDGGLKAPAIFKDQKTIIKGDEKKRAIAFASIIAKVSRDALMREFAKIYPQYGFEIHKGYGTKDHRSAIRKHGMSPLHRRSFCKNIKFDK